MKNDTMNVVFMAISHIINNYLNKYITILCFRIILFQIPIFYNYFLNFNFLIFFSKFLFENQKLFLKPFIFLNIFKGG